MKTSVNVNRIRPITAARHLHRSCTSVLTDLAWMNKYCKERCGKSRVKPRSRTLYVDFYTRLQLTMQGPTTQKSHVVQRRRSVRPCDFQIGLGRASDRIRTRRGWFSDGDLLFAGRGSDSARLVMLWRWKHDRSGRIHRSTGLPRKGKIGDEPI